MIDAHVHIERGPYTQEWIEQFVQSAVKNGVSELYLLEHSHRFVEFQDYYQEISTYNSYQKEWFRKRMALHIDDYANFIADCRRTSYPIRIYWGLEICYIPGKETSIAQIRNKFNWDFLTGSVHWIDSWGFDHKKEDWKGRDADDIYIKYYRQMIRLVQSGLFDHLAHPDSIKCFGNYPTIDLTGIYAELADAIYKNGIKVEISSGLCINYHHPELGINEKLFCILKKGGVEFITASDAHTPDDVGRMIRESSKLL